MNEHDRQLVEENMKLVYHVINTRFPHHIGDEDLEQEGFLALCKAVEKFDESKGVKFGTFAYTVIFNHFRRYFQQACKAIPTASLDFEVTNDDGSGAELHELIADNTTDGLFEVVERESFIEGLSDKQKRVIALRAQDLDNKEIAEILGVHPSAVYQVVNRVRTKWRKENGY